MDDRIGVLGKSEKQLDLLRSGFTSPVVNHSVSLGIGDEKGGQRRVGMSIQGGGRVGDCEFGVEFGGF